MSALNQRIKSAVPNGVRRTLAHALRHVGAPARLKSFLAFDGDFALDLDGRAVRFTYANRWIERDLFWRGWRGYEPSSVALWKRAARNARTIVDIGANSGLFSIVAKTVSPHARVIAFEPLPMFADVLERNAQLNGLDVQLVRAAVSATEGTSQFFVPDELAGNIYSSSLSREHYERHQRSSANVLDVRVVAFDAWSARESVREVDLVKIDAEGHDVEVLEGMRATLERDRPDCLIEVQSDAAGERTMPFFPASDYAYFNVSEEAGPRRVEKLGRSETVNCFICRRDRLKTVNSEP